MTRLIEAMTDMAAPNQGQKHARKAVCGPRPRPYIAGGLLALLAAVSNPSAQGTSPGGVTGAALWVKADQGVTANGSNQVEQWIDQSGSSNTTTQLRAAHPAHTDAIAATNAILRVPNAINFNPTVNFSGATGRSLKGNAAAQWDVTPVAIFAVAVNEEAAGGTPGAIFDGLQSWTTMDSTAAGVGVWGTATDYRLDGSGCGTAITTSPVVGPRLVRGVYTNGANQNGGSVWLDGVQEDTGTNCATNATTLFEVGGRTAGSATYDTRVFNGKIAEVVVYRSAVPAADINKIESYLAIKYGITLRQTPTATDYTDSAAAVIWNAAANATYRNNIAGIGRDDTSALNQKQSRSVNTASFGNLVTVGLGAIAADNASNANTFGADRTFMMWGDDNAAAAQAILVPGTSPTLSRFARVWKVQETLTVGTVTVRVPLTALKGSFPTLIRSTDPAFDSSDQQLPMTPTATDYEVTIDFANGDYFTFAAFLPAPGGVTANLDLWVKANDGTSTTTEAANVATWLDRSGSAHDLTVALPAAAVQPTFKTTSLNFNPAVRLLNVGASNQAMWNQNFLGTTNGNYNIDASVFFAHTPRKAANCSGFATFTSPADAGNGDHPWMGHCTTDNQLALTNTYLGSVARSGAAMTALPNIPALHGYTWRYNIAGSLSFRQNGAVSTLGTYTPGHSGRDFYLWRDNNDDLNDGAEDTNEAIVYRRQLTALENQRVESYLAIKYGITLTNASGGPQDYLNSAGTTTWAGVANPVYHNAVAGIMNDGASGLDQRVSQSVTIGDQIAIAGGAFAFAGTITAQSPSETIADGSSLVWGHNNGSNVINILVTDPNAQAAGIEARMARIWRDQITGTGIPAQLSIRIPATLVETGNPTLRTPALLISPDPTFASGTRVVPLTPTAGFYNATFPTFSAAETYFTIAGATSSVTMTKAFVPTAVAIGGTTRLTFTLTNNSPVLQSALAFTDTLPSGLVVAPTPNAATTCTPGTVNASGSVISLSGGEVAASGACTVEVDVTTAPSITAPLSCPAAATTNGSSNITGLSTNLQLATGFGACVNVVVSADVQIVKTAPTTFDAGATVVYTLTVTNNGPSPAAGVTVTDVLPAQLTFVPAGSSPSCLASGQTVTCTIGALAAGAPSAQTLTLNVQVAPNLPSGTVVNNTATVSATSPDPSSANNSSTVPSPAATGSADLQIVKSTLEPSVTPGLNFTYRLVVTNNGPSSASNVTAADTLPADVSFVSSPGGCTVAGQAVSCGPVATLDPGASQTFDIVVRLRPDYIGTGAEIVNVATTTSDTPDPDSTDNTSNSVTPPTVNAPNADLAATKSAVEPSVSAGETFTWRITVTNNGPSTALNVGATDALHVDLAFVSSPTGCTAAGQNVSCGPVASLAPLASTSFDIVVRLNPAYTGDGSGITNTATATSSTADPDAANNTTNAAAMPTVTAPKADLQIIKSLDAADGVSPGETYSYTLAIQNNGPAYAANVTVTDPLPANVNFVSASPACAYDAGSRTITCTSSFNPMAVGLGEQFTITVQLDPGYAGTGVELTNSATVNTTTLDPAPQNNSSPAGAPPVNAAEADITVVKTASSSPVAPGEQFTYTLLVSNQGPSTAGAAVTVTDTLPAGITFVAGTGCSAAGQDVTCFVGGAGTLVPGQSESFLLTVLLDPSFTGTCADIPNTATAQASTTADPIPANNTSPSACPPLEGNQADVAIAKAASAAPVVPGTTFTYTLTVTNNGPSDALGVAVSDMLPAQLEFVSSPQSCTAAGQLVTCPPIGTLPLASPTATFDLVVRVRPNYVGTGADIQNTATVAATSFDPNTLNNTSAASSPTVAAPSADVSLAKTIAEAAVVPGGTFTYQLVVSNAGPSTATNIQISDPLPTGVTFESAGAGCSHATGTVTCGPVASLDPGQSALPFTFVARLDPAYAGNGSDLGNVATATGFTPDPNTANNSNAPATPNVVAASADVSITKTANEPSVTPGLTFSYNIVVSNAGPSNAANVVVTDTLRPGLTFVSSTGACTAVGQDVSCPLVATLASGASTPVTLTVRLDPAYTGDGADLDNIAVVSSDTADPNTSNNTSTVAVAPTITPPSADVRIVKSVSADPLVPGQNFTYTLTVTNNGPSVATGVVVTDTLPVQTAFVSSAEGCTAAGQSVTCPTLASLGVGVSATFTIVVQLDSSYTGDGTDVLNSSIVSAATSDPAMANNTSPAGAPPVGPGQADLAITKDVSTTPVTPGGTFDFILHVANQGPSDAANVVVTDTLPANLTFSSSAEGCTATGQDVTCPTIATLAAGASATFTLTVTLDASYSGNGSDLTNTAEVESGTTPDPILANNTSNPATPVIGSASSDVSILKSAIGFDIAPGGTFTYRLTVTNNGPSTALGVQVTDPLPAQVAFVSSPHFCNPSGQTVTCPPLGSLAVAATVTFDVLVRLDPSYVGDGSDVVNTATVTSTTADPVGANNTDDVSLTTLVATPSADISITKSVVESSVTPGGSFTYRLTVSNAGPSTAANVDINDPLPSQVTFVSSPDGCTPPTCPAIPALAPGSTATFDLVVQLDPAYAGTGADVANTAAVAASTTDADPLNNSDTVTLATLVTAPSADLVTTKVALEPSVTPGLTFTYRITVTNNGPSVATDVVITDTLPAQLSYVSSGCGVSGSTVTCLVPSLSPGVSATFEIVVRLDAAYTGDGGDIGNVATATSSTPDPNPTNNTNPPAPPPTVRPPSADVAIFKVVSEDAVAPGEQFTYTLTVASIGPSVATNVVVTDTLPPQVTFVSSPDGCTAVGQSVTCPTIPSLAAFTIPTSFTIVVQLDAAYTGDGSDVLNTAIALAETADPAMANNSSRLGAAPVGPGKADLAIVKDVTPDPVAPGTDFSYQIIVTNQGPSVAHNITVTDTLPTGVTPLSAMALGGTCTVVGQVVTCFVPADVAPGSGVIVFLAARLDADYTGNGNDMSNVAIVDGEEEDPVPGNNTSNPATPVIGAPDADVAITKSVVEASVAPGDLFAYRLVVTNTGPSTALGVVVTDPLPTQVSFVSSPQGCTAVAQTVTCPPLGSLAVGASVTFDIRVMLDPLYAGDGSDVINVATSSAATADPVPSNGTSAPIALSVVPSGVDIGVALTAAPPITVTGDVITLTATITNPGPDAATAVTISLPLPLELTFEGVDASVGGYDPSSGVWTIGNLPIGGTATMQLHARVIAQGTPTVNATLTHVDQLDRNPSNNSTSVMLSLNGWSILFADLVLDGTTTAVVVPGGIAAFELTAVNRGPSYVVDLFITGNVPAGTTFAGVVPSAGAVCATPAMGATGTVTCKWPGVTYLDVGAKRTMTVGVRVDAGAAPASSITGSFTVGSLNAEYYEPSNHLTLTTSVAGGGATDLALSAVMQSDGMTGTALALPLGVPTPMRFTIRNTGSTPTTAATYAIEIPSPDIGYLRIGGASFSQGSVGLTGISSAEWHIGPLAPGASAMFDLTVAMQSMRATTIAMRRVSSVPADPNSANDRATLILDGTGHPEGGERFTAIGNIDGVGIKEILVGTGRLETPQVRIINGSGADSGLRFYAYSREFMGGVRVASCDVDADGVDEIITGPGIGPGPHVRVLRMQGSVVGELVGFYAFDPNFYGGVYLSCADVDNDGRADIVASMGEGGSQVKVFGVGKDLVVEKASFTAYEPSFLGGARVAAVGTMEPGGAGYQIVTVSGPGRPLEVRTWSVGGGTATLVRSLPLTGPEYQLGAFIDVADLNRDGLPEAVLSTDRGIAALIGVITLDSAQFQGIFQAYPTSFLGGSRVTLGDVDGNGQMELLITPGYGGRPIVDAYSIFGGSANFILRLHSIEIP